MFDIITAGEVLVDMLHGKGPLDFHGAPGGAPCNLLAQATRFGSRTALVCKLGEDYFGHYLYDYVTSLGIDTTHATLTEEANTTLAFVSLDESGNREFTFYRKPGADMLLCPEDIPDSLLQDCRVFAFGGVSLSREPARSAILDALRRLEGSGIIRAFDPNLRFPLWTEGHDVIRKVILEAASYADIIKLGDDELAFLTQTDTMEAGLARLNEVAAPKLVIITQGPNGCTLFHEGTLSSHATYDVPVKDTTAAGDSFFGAFLHMANSHAPRLPWELGREELVRCVDFANAAGSMTTTKTGAINSLPSLDEVERCMAVMPKL